jgi:hypothetical protein
MQRKNRKRFRSRITSKQQKIAAFTVASLLLVILVSMSTSRSIFAKDVREENSNEILAMVPNDSKEKAQKDYGICTIRTGQAPENPIQSTFTASYPGSGAKMTWKLIEAMTGIVTGDDFQLNGHNNVVSIKTHYPSSEGRPLANADKVPRAILLIRNPLHSIPSYFNFVYEYQNNLPGHSTKAPLEEWIRWRNDNFDRQIQVWRRHAEYWMDTYETQNRMVLCYESLIDDDLGAAEAMKIAEFLNRSDGVTTVTPEEVPCVWHTVIKYKKRRRLQEAEKAVDPQSKRGGPKYIAPYTQQQLQDLISVLTQLLDRYRDDKDLVPVLVSYIDEAAKRSRGPPEDENTVVVET